VYAISGGLECAGLDTSQLKLLQRFMPNFSDPSHSDRLNNNDSSIFYDTNGFFISKFVKDSDWEIVFKYPSVEKSREQIKDILFK
jgi:hypothetical protein